MIENEEHINKNENETVEENISDKEDINQKIKNKEKEINE